MRKICGTFPGARLWPVSPTMPSIALVFVALVTVATVANVVSAPARAEKPAPSTEIAPSAYRQVNRALLKDYILPRYSQLQKASSALVAATQTYCKNAGAKQPRDLAPVRAAFNTTLAAWMQVQHLSFEPVKLLFRNNRLHYWPEARGRYARAVDRMITAGVPAVSKDSWMRRQSAAAQGLPALEYLLYNSANIARLTEKPGNHCRLLLAIARNIAVITTGMWDDWLGGRLSFARLFKTPTRDNPYFQSEKQITRELFQSMLYGLDLIADQKLKPVLGTAIDKTKPQAAENHLSGNSLPNIVNNLDSLQAIYAAKGGLGSLLRTRDQRLDRLMRRAFRLTLANAKSIKAPLTRAVADPALRPKVEKLLLQIRALRQIAKTRLATALDLPVGFNALDGD